MSTKNFATAMNSATSNFSTTENGAVQHSVQSMSSSDPHEDIKAKLVALNVSLVRGNESKVGDIGVDRSHIVTLIQSFIESVNSSDSRVTPKQKEEYITELVTLAFQKRDIRGTYGGGERTLAYWMLVELHKHYPDTIEILMHDLPNYGSWLDFNKMYDI